MDGDTIIITSRGNKKKTSINRGSAYVFIRNEDTWQEQDKLLPNDGVGVDMVDDKFGEAVAFENNTTIITAPFDDDNGQDSGSAYVFICTGNS